jgi:hypothetical protein
MKHRFLGGYGAVRALDGVVAKCLGTGFVSTRSETEIKELGEVTAQTPSALNFYAHREPHQPQTPPKKSVFICEICG